MSISRNLACFNFLLAFALALALARSSLRLFRFSIALLLSAGSRGSFGLGLLDRRAPCAGAGTAQQATAPVIVLIKKR